MAIKAGAWNAAQTAQCVDVNPTGKNTMRVTVRSNAESMEDRESHSRAFARRAAPDDALVVTAELYTQFSSQGFTYMTYVLAWFGK